MILTDLIVVLWSYGYRRFDRGVWVVVFQSYVLVFEIKDAFDLRVERDRWGRQDRAVFLDEISVHVVAVQMDTTHCMNEPTGFITGHLRQHH